MYKNILVAYDGSDIAQKALENAADIAARYEAKLNVIHVNVIAANLRAQAVNQPSLAAVLDESGERVAGKAEEFLTGKGLDYEVTVVNATSAPKPIVEFVNAHQCDLLVIGSRGLGAVKQYFGSVSHAILNTVTIPVLVIKK